jgi:hypothetical protein
MFLGRDWTAFVHQYINCRFKIIIKSSTPSSLGQLEGIYLEAGEEVLDATGAVSSSLTLETLQAEAELLSLSRLDAVRPRGGVDFGPEGLGL